MSRGFVIFAVNNDRVNYLRLAIVCATLIKKHMPNENICLITDEHSNYEKIDLTLYFNDVVFLPSEEKRLFENKRKYLDTQYYAVEAEFKNSARNSVYDLSPYDETILIDSDYLVCSNTLSKCWDSTNDLMISKSAIDLFHYTLNGPEHRLNDYGIKMYWATIIYFKKSHQNELLFGLVEHIKNNWEFYKLVYGFPGHLYRNDYSFSIAIHILNGFSETSNIAMELPFDSILSAVDKDQLYKIESLDNLIFYYQHRQETWKYNLVKTVGLDVHCMNKLSILNKFDQIMEMANV